MPLVHTDMQLNEQIVAHVGWDFFHPTLMYYKELYSAKN